MFRRTRLSQAWRNRVHLFAKNNMLPGSARKQYHACETYWYGIEKFSQFLKVISPKHSSKFQKYFRNIFLFEIIMEWINCRIPSTYVWFTVYLFYSSKETWWTYSMDRKNENQTAFPKKKRTTERNFTMGSDIHTRRNQQLNRSRMSCYVNI